MVKQNTHPHFYRSGPFVSTLTNRLLMHPQRKHRRMITKWQCKRWMIIFLTMEFLVWNVMILYIDMTWEIPIRLRHNVARATTTEMSSRITLIWVYSHIMLDSILLLRYKAKPNEFVFIVGPILCYHPKWYGIVNELMFDVRWIGFLWPL